MPTTWRCAPTPPAATTAPKTPPPAPPPAAKPALAPAPATASAATAPPDEPPAETSAPSEEVFAEVRKLSISAATTGANAKAIIGRRVYYPGDEVAPGITLAEIKEGQLVFRDQAGHTYPRRF